VDGVAGTYIDAGRAIGAHGCIDYHIAINFRDGAFRAFAFASAAIDAFIGIDFVSHDSSFLRAIQISRGIVLPALIFVKRNTTGLSLSINFQ
jgi:hypothetical protein